MKLELPNEYISWKDEGHIGPAYYNNQETYRAWCVNNGIDPDGFGIPYGSKPDGMVDLGWMTRAAARRIARERDLHFQEW